MVKHFISEKIDDNLSDEENIKKYITEADSDNKLYTLSVHKNTGYWEECFLCGKKSCQDCPLKLTDDMTLEELD